MEPKIGDTAKQRHAAGQSEQPLGQPGSSTEPAGAGRRDWERPVVRRGERLRVDQVRLRLAAAGIGVMSGCVFEGGGSCVGRLGWVFRRARRRCRTCCRKATPGERSGIRAGMVRLKAGADWACRRAMLMAVGSFSLVHTPLAVDVHQVKVAIKAQPSGLVRDPGRDERVTGSQTRC